MTNKLGVIFSLILCFAVFGGEWHRISAQTGRGGDKILVAGQTALRQSHVDSVIEFYEWAFQARFNSEERRRYQAIIVAAFRQNDVESIKGVETLIRAMAKIRTLDDDSQRKMRDVFNEDFVKELRSSRDESAPILLAVYERGQQQQQSGETSESGFEAPAKSPGSGAKNLIGKWTRTLGGPRGDDGTGKTTYSSGENTTFEFFADGRMQFTYDKKVLSIMQCRISETSKIPGAYTVEGDRLTINLGAGSSVGTNSCEAKGNFRKTLTASTVTKSFVVRKMKSLFRPDEPLLLCFDGTTNDNECFERDPKN